MYGIDGLGGFVIIAPLVCSFCMEVEMAKKKSKSKLVPATTEDAERMIREIGEAQRRALDAKNEADREIERIKKAAAVKIAVQSDRISERFEGLAVYANEHREELVDKPDAKTITLVTGTISWRLNPHSVSLKGVEDVLEYLKTHKEFKDFLNYAEPTVDKEAMLKDEDRAEQVPGVTINRDIEMFAVKPSDGTGEIAMPLKIDTKLKREVA